MTGRGGKGEHLLVIELCRYQAVASQQLAAHGITVAVVDQVSNEKPRFRRNKKGRAASHQMIGPDRGGAIWVICILEMPLRAGLWRAVTGWRARGSEQEWYRRST